MTLKIGNNFKNFCLGIRLPQFLHFKPSFCLPNHKVYSSRGFTFIEVMVTLVILSIGIVTIFKVFVVSLDRMSYLTNRLYATTLIDNRMFIIEKTLRADHALPLEIEEPETVHVGAKKIKYSYKTSISEVGGLYDIFQIDLSLQWKEGGNPIKISRSTYIFDLRAPVANK